MTKTASRRLTPAALAACVCLNLLAGCVVDEPATFLPRSGTWSYEEEAVVSNSCSDQIGSPDPLTTFLLDYDQGDEFQIEVGVNDIVCEIDGTEFTCGAYHAGDFDVPGFAATVSYNIQYAGEFASDSIANGNEVTTVTCTGEACTNFDMLPCSRNVTFNAEFLL